MPSPIDPAQSWKFCWSSPQRRAISVIFDGQYYDQIDGVAMGSPLGPVSANIFMCDLEEKWVLNDNARPSIWFRYLHLVRQ